MFQFSWDDENEPEYPVVYVFELQVSLPFRRNKLGRALMGICMDIGKHWKMFKVV